MDVPGKSGKYDFGSEYDQRVFELSLITLGTSTDVEVQTVIRSLANELTDNNGLPREVKLRFDKEPDKYYEVKLHEDMGITRSPGKFGEITLRLVATDPFAFTPSDYTSKEISHNGGTLAVTNSGNVEAPAKLTITNTGSTTINGFKIYQEV